MRVFKRLNIRLIGSCMAAVLLVFSVICTVFFDIDFDISSVTAEASTTKSNWNLSKGMVNYSSETLLSEEDYADYTESDTINGLNKTIQDYQDDLWGSNRTGDDPIIYIVPKDLFMTPCEVSYLGGEYGFYIKTEDRYVETEDESGNSTQVWAGYQSDVFVFDLKKTVSESGNEYVTTLTPLFIEKYYSEANESGVVQYVTPQTILKVDYSEEYFISNVSFGYSVLNEHSYNQADVGYEKNADNGPIIQQVRFNCAGYSGKELNIDWDTIATTALDVLKCVPVPLVSNIATLLDNAIKTIKKQDAALNCVSYEWEENVYNNELNIKTFPDKAGYGEGEDYLKSVCMVSADNGMVYTTGTDTAHYAQGIALLTSLEEPFRLYRSIGFDIVKVDYQGNIEEVDSCYNTLCEKFEDYGRTEISQWEVQNLYTLAGGEQKYSFIPEYSGYYDINTDDASLYDVYLYPVNGTKGEPLSSLENIYLTAGQVYNLDLLRTEGENSSYGAVSFDLQELNPETENLFSVKGNSSVVCQFNPTDDYIKKLQSSNSNVVIKDIINLSNSSMSVTDINEREIAYHFEKYTQYIIVLQNNSSTEMETSVSLQEVDELTGSAVLRKNDDNIYKFTPTSTDTYVFSFEFEDGVSLAISILNKDGGNVPLTEGFGLNYKTLNVYLQKSMTYYIVIRDSSQSESTLNISWNTENLALKWYVNGEYQAGAYGIRQGETISIELRVNGISIQDFMIEGDEYNYKISTENGEVRFTLAENSWLGGNITIQAVRIDANGTEISVSTDTTLMCYAKALTLEPQVRYSMNTGIYEWNDESGYGITWSDSDIVSVTYNLISGNRDVTMTISSQNSNSIRNKLRTWNAESSESVLVKIESVVLKGIDKNENTHYSTITNGELGLEISDISINPWFGINGSGTMNDPFEISCTRHFENINNMVVYNDDINEDVVSGYFILTADITLPNGFTALDNGYAYFNGSINGNGHTISNFTASGSNGYVGLIKNNYAHIYDLTLRNFSISVDGDGYVVGFGGVLCGYNHGTIENVTVINSNITGNRYSVIGGLIGMSENGSITDCIVSSNVTIKGTYIIGGIVGTSTGDVKASTFYGKIEYTGRCEITEDVVYEARIGGITGTLDDRGTVEESRFAGSIVVSFADKNDETLQPCIGGIVGLIYSGEQTGNSVSGSFDLSNLNEDVRYGFLWLSKHNQKENCGIYVGSPLNGSL